MAPNLALDSLGHGAENRPPSTRALKNQLSTGHPTA